MAKYTVETISDHTCELGEGPHWDDSQQKLYYVDIFKGEVCRWDPQTKQTERKFVGRNVSAVIPYQNDSDHLIVSRGKQLLKVNWSTEQTEVLVEVEKDSGKGNRFNDGKCDAKGRLWVGTMGPESSPGVLPPEQGSLYCFDHTGKIVRKLPKISLSNGLAWTSDNKKMFFIDSTKREIYVFDYDLESGNISNQKCFVNLKNNSDFDEKEIPDGMTIDGDNNLWIALFFGGRLVKIDPNSGRVTESISLPQAWVKTTSACFGGKNLDQLFITCASAEISAEERSQNPLAGRVFRVTSTDKSFRAARPNTNFYA